MADTCSTTDFKKIKQAFWAEKLILAEDGGWDCLGVFLTSDEQDEPGIAVVRSAVGDLTLWRKIGLAERPTADLVIRWLKDSRPARHYRRRRCNGCAPARPVSRPNLGGVRTLA